MKLYRGQLAGDPVGQWWTTDPDDAQSYATARAGRAGWVVLMIEADGRTIRRYRFDRAMRIRGRRRVPFATYRLPMPALRRLVLAAAIVCGSLPVPELPLAC